MMRWSWLLLIVVLAACGGGGSSTPTPTPDARAEAERQVGFAVVLPSRLPKDVDPTPRIKVNNGTQVAIDYSHQVSATGAASPAIQITEQKDVIHHGGVTYVTKTLAGVAVQCGETSTATGGPTAGIDCFWQEPDKWVSALLSWGTKTYPQPLTDEMRQVADDVVSSIIEVSALRAGGSTTPSP